MVTKDATYKKHGQKLLGKMVGTNEATKYMNQFDAVENCAKDKCSKEIEAVEKLRGSSEKYKIGSKKFNQGIENFMKAFEKKEKCVAKKCKTIKNKLNKTAEKHQKIFNKRIRGGTRKCHNILDKITSVFTNVIEIPEHAKLIGQGGSNMVWEYNDCLKSVIRVAISGKLSAEEVKISKLMGKYNIGPEIYGEGRISLESSTRIKQPRFYYKAIKIEGFDSSLANKFEEQLNTDFIKDCAERVYDLFLKVAQKNFLMWDIKNENIVFRENPFDIKLIDFDPEYTRTISDIFLEYFEVEMIGKAMVVFCALRAVLSGFSNKFGSKNTRVFADILLSKANLSKDEFWNFWLHPIVNNENSYEKSDANFSEPKTFFSYDKDAYNLEFDKFTKSTSELISDSE